jgi:hypothetical protein
MKEAHTPVRPLGDFLRVLAPPAIWFMHLVVIYGAEALICIGPSPSGAAMVRVVVLATVAALIGLVVSAAMVIRPGFVFAARPGGGSTFLAGTALMLTVLAGLAVIWAAVPAVALPACASPAG